MEEKTKQKCKEGSYYIKLTTINLSSEKLSLSAQLTSVEISKLGAT